VVRIPNGAVAAGAGVLALVLLSACQPGETGDLPPVGEELVAVEKARCEARDGIWGRASDAGGFVCLERTRDANTSCTRGTDCQGLCLARSRTCAPVDPFLGCHEVLTDSGARATICTD